MCTRAARTLVNARGLNPMEVVGRPSALGTGNYVRIRPRLGRAAARRTLRRVAGARTDIWCPQRDAMCGTFARVLGGALHVDGGGFSVVVGRWHAGRDHAAIARQGGAH